MRRPSHRLLPLWLLIALPIVTVAHPLPDIPITSSFDKGGKGSIHVVVDPRCFEEDPNMAPYLLNKDLAAMAPEKQAALKAKVKQFLAEIVTFHFDPSGEVKPTFELDFGSVDDNPLLLPEDPVMVVADWQTQLPPGTQQYQIKVTPKGTFSVLFFNKLLGKKVERFQVLFPGEESFKLDVQPVFAATTVSPSTTGATAAQGTWLSPTVGSVMALALLVSVLVFKRRPQ